jgi:RNA polymerase sigma-70 factor (ECF subfamily)
MFALFKSKSALTEAELLKRFKETKEEQYFNQLFNHYAHLVLGSCIRYLEDEEKAKDAVLEIFAKLLTDLEKYPVEHFASWLYMVTKNHCLMKLRKQKSEAIKLEEYRLGQDSFMENGLSVHPNEANEKEMLLRQMETCLETLALPQRTCVELFYLSKYNYQQVSEKCGFDLNQVKSFIQNGKRNLKICIESALKAA